MPIYSFYQIKSVGSLYNSILIVVIDEDNNVDKISSNGIIKNSVKFKIFEGSNFLNSITMLVYTKLRQAF